jgi:hypothetical protein
MYDCRLAAKCVLLSFPRMNTGTGNAFLRRVPAVIFPEA